MLFVLSNCNWYQLKMNNHSLKVILTITENRGP